ncbi:thioesterase family protein [Aeromicrobium duanguangcaii]|uniref:Acyl-[acyl-carrier-protein] thioesterase n=1 Tax=Aeromicrobium duanguangcaii TaxID=2968086 RepID=A0ABY5KG27_9ACTN|nr:thioesterase family protein [Aeromicrobium duanguangcaii]MCD9154614.1 acyl-[acyl-carrier-protein] thioesterase [Aeromicrobium duanguangcaii]MCL3838732.1 acyl-[acyl-carrier-protein] thioesterase [Aeromicrobium duanguangcaii]UUI67971.1 acyl-[acyl-carrier-protein] thioesterase [Aeromicrobium duanguangcaii]
MTEFRHDIPMRWADLDSLNHVNNVVYLRYAENARAAMSEVPPGPIGAMRIQFKRPLLLGSQPVVVTSRVEGDQVLQSIGVAGTDTEFATVEVDLGKHAAPEVLNDAAQAGSIAVRRTDLDGSGHVSAAQVFELFQETRVPFINGVLTRLTPGNFVVASVEARYHQPIEWRPALETRTRVARVGNGSFTIEAQLGADGQTFASSSAVLVGFEAAKQSSRKFSQEERQSLLAAMG